MKDGFTNQAYASRVRIQNPIFVAKELDTSSRWAIEEEGEAAINNLLYRNSREFATGHGVAANWLKPSEQDTHSASVFTEFIPSYEVPQLIPPSDQVEGAILDMQLLAEATDGATVVRYVGTASSYVRKVDRLTR